MAGARLGLGIATKKLIQDINTIRYSNNPYNINRMTMAAGIGTIEDNDYTVKNCMTIIKNREYLCEELKKLGFTTLKSSANFIFTKNDNFSGEYLYKKLKENGVLVRYFNKARLSQFLRITIGSMDEINVLLEKLKLIMEESK